MIINGREYTFELAEQDEWTVRCANCGKVVDPHELPIVVPDNYVCDECAGRTCDE